MPRIGIEVGDVYRAADLLAQKNQRVTVSAVRAVLGTGSQSTIVRHLSSWRAATREKTDTVPVSPEFLLTIQREMDSAVSAALRTEREQAAIRETDVIELGRSLEVLEADIAALREQLSSAVDAREQLRGRLDAQLDYSKQCDRRIEQLREQVVAAEKRAAVAEAQSAAQAEMTRDARQRLQDFQSHGDLTPLRRRPKSS